MEDLSRGSSPTLYVERLGLRALRRDGNDRGGPGRGKKVQRSGNRWSDTESGVRPRGKGSKERMVPIAPGLYATLRDYVLARSTLNPRDFLAQVPNCVPHRFRHLFATDLLRQGTDIRYTPGAPRALAARHDGDLHAGRQSGAREGDQAAADYRPGFWATPICGQSGAVQVIDKKEKRQRRPVSRVL